MQTLAADDIIQYYLTTNPDAFDVVLFAEADPDARPGSARVSAGADGLTRLKALMAEPVLPEARFTLPKFKPAFPGLLSGKAK